MNQPTEEQKDEEQHVQTDQLAILQAKCDEYLAGWKRSQADYQNLKREQEGQMKRLSEMVNAGLLMDILPIIDHFDLAVRHIPENESKQEWVRGFYHIKKQFDDFLEKLGVKKIETLGKQLDTRLHEAIETRESERAEGEILEEAQAGYVLNDYILRHAKVVVSKGKQYLRVGVGGKSGSK